MSERGIRCGRCSNYHPSVADVRECFNGKSVTVVNVDLGQQSDGAKFVRPTPAQLKYVKGLLNRECLILCQGVPNLAKRQTSEIIDMLKSGKAGGAKFRKVDFPAYCTGGNGDCQETAAWLVSGVTIRNAQLCESHKTSTELGDFGKRFSYTRLSEAKPAKPAKPATESVKPADAPELEAGIYRHNDRIYKVQRAVHGSGHMYAKALELPRPEEIAEWSEEKAKGRNPTEPRGRFVHAPGLVRRIRSEERMTLEMAKDFSKEYAARFGVEMGIYGVCCSCGRTLTREESITKGIGPICEGKFS